MKGRLNNKFRPKNRLKDVLLSGVDGNILSQGYSAIRGR